MRINSIKCKRSHRKKAEKRFFRALLAFLAGIILKSNGIQAIAGEQDYLFWQDIGGVGAPFQPVEILPLEVEECFIPITGDEQQVQGISVSYHAANHRYQLDGLWNDRGITMHVLEDRGIGEQAYIERFGFPAGRSAGGLTLTDQNRGIRYLYREADGETALTEPRGYDGYQWQESQDQQNYTDVDTTSAQTRMFLPDTIRSGTTYFRCIASAAGEKFILGEDYAIVYYRLPTVRGLRIKEVSHAG